MGRRVTSPFHIIPTFRTATHRLQAASSDCLWLSRVQRVLTSARPPAIASDPKSRLHALERPRGCAMVKNSRTCSFSVLTRDHLFSVHGSGLWILPVSTVDSVSLVCERLCRGFMSSTPKSRFHALERPSGRATSKNGVAQFFHSVSRPSVLEP